MDILYQSSLVGHILGITLMAGASFIDIAAFRAYRKLAETDSAKAAVLLVYFNKLQRFMSYGMLLILVSGILMMIKLHAVWGAQLWFRIKMALVLLVIINGLGIRRRVGEHRLLAVQTIQVCLFIIIFVLSVFKFN